MKKLDMNSSKTPINSPLIRENSKNSNIFSFLPENQNQERNETMWHLRTPRQLKISANLPERCDSEGVSSENLTNLKFLENSDNLQKLISENCEVSQKQALSFENMVKKVKKIDFFLKKMNFL